MNKFNLKKAMAGAKVCTRYGLKVRIICFDAQKVESRPIIGLVSRNSGWETVYRWHADGMSHDRDWDLFMDDGSDDVPEPIPNQMSQEEYQALKQQFINSKKTKRRTKA